MKRATMVDLIEAVKGLQVEVSTLRAELAPRRRAAKVGQASMTAVEAAKFLGMDRKTFYRRGLPAILTREGVTGRFTRRSVEAVRAKMEGASV